mgnify:CR=1 FL=1
MPALVKRIMIPILIGLFLIVLKCTSQQTTGTGGTGSETVIGKIIKQDGTPADLTVVTMYPSDFDPAKETSSSVSYSDTTGPDGCYRMSVSSAVSNHYTLYAVNLKLRTRTIVPDIQISQNGDSTPVAPATLYNTGSIKVFLHDVSIDTRGYVYIQGTSYHYFKGCMDELRISSVVRSAAWIRLCYVNQGDDSLFVLHNQK